MNVDAVLGLSGLLAYLVVGLMAAGESAAFVGLFLPGETVMVLGGVLAATGHANLTIMIVVAVAGAIVGDAVGYVMGRAVGPALRTGRLGRAIGSSRWDRAEDIVIRRGPVAVFLGRWVGILRALVPAVAGVVRMPFRRFLLWNAVGGVSWATAVVLVGYFGGASYTGLASRCRGRVDAAGRGRYRRRRGRGAVATPAASARPCGRARPGRRARSGWRARGGGGAVSGAARARGVPRSGGPRNPHAHRGWSAVPVGGGPAGPDESRRSCR